MKNALSIHTAIIVLSALFAATTAFSADNPNYKMFYLVNGAKASAEQAIIASLKGAETFKCQSVESKVSKSGTSIGIRNVKRKAN